MKSLDFLTLEPFFLSEIVTLLDAFQLYNALHGLEP
jgi:hypothetical protein